MKTLNEKRLRNHVTAMCENDFGMTNKEDITKIVEQVVDYALGCCSNYQQVYCYIDGLFTKIDVDLDEL